MKVKKRFNEKFMPVSNIIKSKIDVKGGKMTFGQRIELGEIFQSLDDEYLKFERVFLCLHNYKPKPKEYVKLADYFKEIVQGVIHWIEQENTMLKYEPSTEELQAGVKDLSAKIGEFGTIKALDWLWLLLI